MIISAGTSSISILTSGNVRDYRKSWLSRETDSKEKVKGGVGGNLLITSSIISRIQSVFGICKMLMQEGAQKESRLNAFVRFYLVFLRSVEK